MIPLLVARGEKGDSIPVPRAPRKWKRHRQSASSGRRFNYFSGASETKGRAERTFFGFIPSPVLGCHTIPQVRFSEINFKEYSVIDLRYKLSGARGRDGEKEEENEKQRGNAPKRGLARTRVGFRPVL